MPALLLPVFVPAQVTAPDTTVTCTAAPTTPVANPLTFYGFVDGYFGYDFHDSASPTSGSVSSIPTTAPTSFPSARA